MLPHAIVTATVPDKVHISGVLTGRRAECGERTKTQIDWFMQVETHATFTLNWHYMEDYRSKFEAFYKLIRRHKHGYAEFIQRLMHPDTFRPPPPPAGTLSLVTGERIHPETDAQKLARLRLATIAMGLPADSWSDSSVLRLLPDDGGEGAVKIMADVRAYWQGKLATTRAKCA